MLPNNGNTNLLYFLRLGLWRQRIILQPQVPRGWPRRPWPMPEGGVAPGGPEAEGDGREEAEDDGAGWRGTCFFFKYKNQQMLAWGSIESNRVIYFCEYYH